MPFNRVNTQRVATVWLQIMRTKEPSADSVTPTKNNQLETSEKKMKLPTYIPGLNLVPIPEAGIFGKFDVAFQAVFLYVLGSIFYVADSFYIWPRLQLQPDDDSPASYTYPGPVLNLVAAVIFVVNALFCILDWWLQRKNLSIMNMDLTKDKSAVVLNDIPFRMNIYYFINNLFFLAAAIIYTIQGIWLVNPSTDIYNCNPTFCGIFWINFWGSSCYVISAVFSVLEGLEDAKNRKLEGLPRLKWVSLKWREIDWFAWGDWIYVFAGLQPLIQTFISVYVNDDDTVSDAPYLVGNIIFLVDSLAYFVGYMVYLFDLRDALLSGYLSSTQEAIMNNVLRDSVIVQGSSSSSSSTSRTADVRRTSIVDMKSMLSDVKQSTLDIEIVGKQLDSNGTQEEEDDDDSIRNPIHASSSSATVWAT